MLLMILLCKTHLSWYCHIYLADLTCNHDKLFLFADTFLRTAAFLYKLKYIVQLCCGITHGKMLNGELYAQRLHRLIYLIN